MKDVFDEVVEQTLGKDSTKMEKEVAGRVKLDEFKAVLTKNLK